MATVDEPALSTRGVAVVTGGSAGLGRAITRELAVAGWDVAVLALGEDGVDAAVAEVRAAGRRALGVLTDIVHADAVDRAADRVEVELGPIDVWVNNAMAGVFGEFLEVSADEFDRATGVTYLGTVNGTRAALRRMTARDHGHLVQIGSSLAYKGHPAAGHLLRRQARDGRHDRIRHLRNAPPPQSRPRLHGPHARAEHRPGQLRPFQLPDHPRPVPPIFSPRSGPAPCGTSWTIHAVAPGWVDPPPPRCSITGSPRDCWTTISAAPVTAASRPGRMCVR